MWDYTLPNAVPRYRSSDPLANYRDLLAEKLFLIYLLLLFIKLNIKKYLSISKDKVKNSIKGGQRWTIFKTI